MRFCLVDRITKLEAGKSISAIKNLTSGEEYLADHFPGFPIMPGVMMVESLVQAGGWLMRYTENFAYSTVLLMDCTVQSRDDQQYVLKCTGTVDGGPAVSARLTLEQFNLSDHNPEMAETDRRAVEVMRERFDCIWPPVAPI